MSFAEFLKKKKGEKGDKPGVKYAKDKTKKAQASRRSQPKSLSPNRNHKRN